MLVAVPSRNSDASPMMEPESRFIADSAAIRWACLHIGCRVLLREAEMVGYRYALIGRGGVRFPCWGCIRLVLRGIIRWKRAFTRPGTVLRLCAMS